jgi:peroxiredoxin
VSERIDELGDDTDVVLIVFGDEPFEQYEARNPLAFPILRDLDRNVYRAYGLGRGSFTDVWNWAAVKKYASILRRGRRHLERATEDTRQLAGDFVIAPDGTLAWGYWGDGPADRPSVDDVIAAVAASR